MPCCCTVARISRRWRWTGGGPEARLQAAAKMLRRCTGTGLDMGIMLYGTELHAGPWHARASATPPSTLPLDGIQRLQVASTAPLQAYLAIKLVLPFEGLHK